MEETQSFVEGEAARAPAAPRWLLAVALDCAHPREQPVRLVVDCARVEVGRGSARRWLREGGVLALELDDRWMSQRHFALTREGDGLALADSGSKNGTFVNGVRVAEAALADGDVIESGGTFLVARRSEGPAGDLDGPAGPHPSLRTLSPAFARTLDLLDRVARSALPLLIRGDSGTGKEIAARAAHELSGRGGPFVPVNCGALTPTLVTSELFGVKRGAFSGATEDRPGLIRTAEGGTLFLDEIAELPAEAQATLLRVLQEREVLPVGGSRAIPVDLRVLSATHRPLDELVAGGGFRRDLLARLRGYQIDLPDLAERREDLGLLVAALLGRLGAGHTLSRAAGRALMLHAWPQHVRELEQALGSAIAIARHDDDEIGIDDLPETVRHPGPGTLGTAEDPERFRALVDELGGNVSALARTLRTSRTHVRRLAERHGVALDDARGKR